MVRQYFSENHWPWDTRWVKVINFGGMSKGIKATLWTKFDRRRREEEEGEEDRRKTISLHLKGFQINDFKLYKPTSSCCTVRSGINMSRFICSTVLPKRINKWRIIDSLIKILRENKNRYMYLVIPIKN